LRDFRVGDSLRQIDWRATARFQKPISREYQEERNQQVLGDMQSAEIESIDDALRYCGVTRHLQEQVVMFSELRSDNIIVADTAPAYMHSTLINQ